MRKFVNTIFWSLVFVLVPLAAYAEEPAAAGGGALGPGLGAVGPSENFAHFPGYVKMVLSLAMIAGRLEIFTVLVLFFPRFWRR